MTAKRFKFICDDEKCFFKDGNKALYCYEVVDLLNSLSDENEQLKQKNKGLQSELHIFKEDVTHSNKIIDKLNDENEQLKIALKDKENLISICEKKFKELGYLITCDDDGYTVEKI